VVAHAVWKRGEKKRKTTKTFLIPGLIYYAPDSPNYVPSFGRTTNKNFNRKNTEEIRVRGKPREVSKNSRYPGSDMNLELLECKAQYLNSRRRRSVTILLLEISHLLA